MNSNRRADLQRKLSMGAVPRPPAGLAQRIKNDIPAYLQAEPERQRFSRSIAFSMRVAASILLLITSVFVTLNLLEPDAKQHVAQSGRVRLAPAVMPLDQPARGDARANAAPAEEIRVEMTEEMPQATPTEIPAAGVSAPRPVTQLADAANETRRRQEAVDEAMERDRRAPEPVPVPSDPESVSVTAEAPLIAQSAPAGYAEAVPMPPAAPVPPPAAKTRLSSSFVREAHADGLDLGAKKNVFGITVDPDVFDRIRTSLESGARPDEDIVNVEALVNYFAGPPSRPPHRGVRLEVEASPAPVQTEGDHAVLRFTVDTPAMETQPGTSIPPIARDVRVDVDFNGQVVAGFHRIGDDDSIEAESVLLYNVSVTALYDVELRPRLGSAQRVATVRLRYRSVTDGKQHSTERVIHGHDLAGDWAHASRRHRLASLGAIWAESLRGTPQGIDVARRAEELVTQNPKDPLARELAHAASASGGEK